MDSVESDLRSPKNVAILLRKMSLVVRTSLCQTRLSTIEGRRDAVPWLSRSVAQYSEPL
jgi:hypothetical protein